MTAPIQSIQRNCRQRVDLARRLAEETEQWKIDHENANRVCELEIVVAEMIGTAGPIAGGAA